MSFIPREYESPLIPSSARKAIPSASAISTGGQSTRRVLTSVLEDAKRRARLQGRTLSGTDVEGITRGHFGQAGERLATRKRLALEERGQDIGIRGQNIEERLRYAGLTSAESMHKGRLDLDRYAIDQQIKAAKKGRKAAMWSGAMGALGTVGGAAAGTCIIITACTSPNSYEVEIAREYRDTWLDIVSLAGYYRLSDIIVPLIDRYGWFKCLMKKWLVDRLVDYGEWSLGYKLKCQYRTSGFITNNFLRLCNLIGRVVSIERAVECLLAHGGGA